MSKFSRPIIFLTGAGGGAPDLSVFRENAEDPIRFEVVDYPGWRRYLAGAFTAEVLVADLVKEITARVPQGPICIIGLSIGGHLGYAAALQLQAMGREIAGFCAIDTFMISSSKPSAGWKGRALTQALELLRSRRFSELAYFLRSKFWRSLVRLTGGRLSIVAGRIFSVREASLLSRLDPVLEEELNMRLLIQTAAPWIASLDQDPTPLYAPATLLRTALVSQDDAAWHRRCPNIKIFEIPGRHHSLFEPENVAALHETFMMATSSWLLRR